MRPHRAQTIQEVIDQLDELINDGLRRADRIGYFAALYQRVTINVKRAIIAGNVFEDNLRMETLDVVFASRFLDAYYDRLEGLPTTRVWQAVFDQLENPDVLVMQHLLLAMNAHINLDLGIAAASIMQGQVIEDLENDFNTINKILARLIKVVEVELGQVAPRLGTIDNMGGSIDARLFNFVIDTARAEAWDFACHLSRIPAADWNFAISSRDGEMTRIANAILEPGFMAERVVDWIRQTESTDVRANIQVVGG